MNEEESQELVLTWAEFYGGPADGESVPIDLEGPHFTEMPYLTSDGREYGYVLYHNGDNIYRYVLRGYAVSSPWIPFTQ